MVAERTATTVWHGTLASGDGSLSANSSGAFTDLPLTFAARTQAPEGKTSPEELLAGAQASCYAMALSHVLAEAKTPAEQLDVQATCAFDADALKVTTMHITVRGRVPGADAAAFEAAARRAGEICPVANALRAGVEITLTVES